MIFKLLLLAGLILVVLFAFKTFDKAKKAKLRGGGAKPDLDDGRGGAEKIDAEDMIECPVCSEYVAPNSAASCGRDDCPY
jgi:hypothetical protein